MAKKHKRILNRFGRYLLLDHLVDGGMAKICRARLLSEQAGKIVAIKMVQPQFSQDENFQKMFMDEIKVTMGLIHPNIAQTYDSGIVENQLFTVMEYVDGKNLKEFLDCLKRKDFVFPIEISVHIISQVCQALSYAHNFTDKLTGKKSRIIHRDISPHNIMITYDGAVKVIDFGIAKAETNSDATKAGTIKGKLSYLAPEYLEGLPLDHRYDQFSVGVTLWELLCSRKLFKANNELAVLKLIQSCKIPKPSSINPQVPLELDEIVLRALSKDRKLRYENMDQLNRALVKFLYSHYPDFNATDLSYFSRELFKEDIKYDRELLFEFGQIDIKPFIDEIDSDKSKEPRMGEGLKKTYTIKKKANSGTRPKQNIIDLGFDETEDSNATIQLENKGDSKTSMFKVEGKIEDEEKASKDDAAQETKSGHRDLESIDEIEELNVNVEETTFRNTRGAIRKADLGSLQPESSNFKLKVTGEKTKQYKFKKEKKKKFRMAIAAGVAFIAFSYVYYSPNESEQEGALRSPSHIKNIEKEKVQEIKKEGSLTLLNANFNQEVYLNGVRTEISGLGIKVPVGENIELRVEEKNRKTFVQTFSLTEVEPKVTIRVPEMPLIMKGELVSGNKIRNGQVLVIQLEDYTLTEDLPLTRPLRLPVGEYQALIRNPASQTEQKVEFVIEKDQRARLP